MAPIKKPPHPHRSNAATPPSLDTVPEILAPRAVTENAEKRMNRNAPSTTHSTARSTRVMGFIPPACLPSRSRVSTRRRKPEAQPRPLCASAFNRPSHWHWHSHRNNNVSPRLAHLHRRPCSLAAKLVSTRFFSIFSRLSSFIHSFSGTSGRLGSLGRAQGFLDYSWNVSCGSSGGDFAGRGIGCRLLRFLIKQNELRLVGLD